MKNVPQTMESFGFKEENITNRAKELWSSGWFKAPSKEFDPHHPIGQELFIEGLVQAAGKSKLNENELSRKMAGIIASTYTKDEEKFKVLSALSLRLYRNYNTARNPQYNNPKNNPFNAPLPEGDITANKMFEAAANFDVFQGGVCNDISEVVAQVGEHLFPDKDVLTVNGGSHFGVVVTDGKTHRIIDGGDEYATQNKLLLVPQMSPTNLRINQVKNGALREIAVVDTEMGQLTEAAFKTGKKLLKTDADISSLIAHLKKGNFTTAAGIGNLSDSKVIVVVAKYETGGDKLKGYVGTGLTAQRYDNGQPVKYQIHVKAGTEAKLLHYMNKSSEVNITSGLHANYTHTINPVDFGPGKYKIDMSGGLDWVNKVDVNYGRHDDNAVQVKASVQTEHSLGPTNWGNTTGATSYVEPSDIKPLLKNVTFHLNQVNAELDVEKRITNKLTVTSNAQYQGSNIGQRASILAGLKIKAPKNAEILIFTGYANSSLKGYKTQHSLLTGPKGAEAGVRLTTKKGIEIEAKASRSLSGKPTVRATLSVPLTNNSGR